MGGSGASIAQGSGWYRQGGPFDKLRANGARRGATKAERGEARAQPEPFVVSLSNHELPFDTLRANGRGRRAQLRPNGARRVPNPSRSW